MSFLSSLAKVAVPVAAAIATGGASAWATAAVSAVDAFGGGKSSAGNPLGSLAEVAAGALGASPAVAKLAGTAVGTLAGGMDKPMHASASAARAPSGSPAYPAQPSGTAATCACGTDEDEADLLDDAEDCEAGDAPDCGMQADGGTHLPFPPCPADLIGGLGQFIAGGGLGGMIVRDVADHRRALPQPCPQARWQGAGW